MLGFKVRALAGALQIARNCTSSRTDFLHFGGWFGHPSRLVTKISECRTRISGQHEFHRQPCAFMR